MEIIFIGASGFGRSVAAWLRHNNNGDTVKGYIDDAPQDVERLPAPLLGNTDDLPNYAGHYFLVTVGTPKIRKLLTEKALAAGLVPYTFIHHTAVVASDSTVAEGSIIAPGVIVGSWADVGPHTLVNVNSIVSHDCIVGEYCTILPLVSVSGWTKLGAGVTCGTGSVIIQNLSVGEGSFIAAGASVIKDVPANTLVAGVPAQVKKQL